MIRAVREVLGFQAEAAAKVVGRTILAGHIGRYVVARVELDAGFGRVYNHDAPAGR